MDNAVFNRYLEQWYKEYGRFYLPWRQTTDPYSIWIAEVMLQQTQVNRVADQYYLQFLKTFPDVQTLARAEWSQVYQSWKGLGYYSRARNLMKTALAVSAQFGGIFPSIVDKLLTLPGIGPYTARAIVAFSGDQKVAAFDTNLRQLMQAFFPHSQPEKKANELVFQCRCGGRMWNSSAMDLASALRSGATFDAKYDTFISPATRNAIARKRSAPRREFSAADTIIDVGIACIHGDGKYLLQRYPERPGREGQEFPGGKRQKGESLRACVKREIYEELGIEVSVRPAFMSLLRERKDRPGFFWRLHFHRCQIQLGKPKEREGQILEWVSPAEFDRVRILGDCDEVLSRLRDMKL